MNVKIRVLDEIKVETKKLEEEELIHID